MSLQGPIVVIGEQQSSALIDAISAAGALPVIESSCADAAAAIPKVHASKDCLDYFEHMQVDVANAGTSVLHFEQMR